MTTPNDPTMSHDSLDAVIAAYMLAVEAANVPNRQELIDHHPEHADALRAFFADLDCVDRVASPLRIAAGPDETGAAGANAHDPLPTVRYFGDYELLEEIARGGMGIVYKARQTSLNRLVALKMILAGSFASSRDVLRFRSEAESAANLDHPHIVPIYEIGEHGGQQYYSMKFVEGTSLAACARGDLRAEVRGLVDVARAVHHAHQRGVLHRDLKPSNVLVDSQGSRLVTDFGLAKRLASGDRTFTETGQVLGTPKYMSPEQAAGRKDLTVSADVYSLGVIIFERLTGQTPFTGDNPLTLLRQARESEPPRPSTIRPGLDRDLETVALKCLEKEPIRRYQAAEALADDLANWLDGRPITARPVGQAERFWRWCRRNPAVAGLTAAVALALVAGAVVSGFFAMAERRGRLRAELAEHEAIDANDRTERTFAQSLARPLDPNGDEPNHGTLSEQETGALWELSLNQGQPIGYRFLNEATRDPITLRQLRARSEPALVAAVGLDTSRRASASRLLSERLRDQDRPLWSKAELALLALELEDQPGAAPDDYAGIVVQALGADRPENLRTAWRNHLIDGSTRLEPRIAARLLAATMDRETSAEGRYQMASALTTVANGLERPEAELICGGAAQCLANALAQEENSGRHPLATALAELSAWLEPRQAGEMLITALARESNESAPKWLWFADEAFMKALSTVTARLKPDEAAPIYGQEAKSLAAALVRTTNPGESKTLESELSIVLARLQPAQSARVSVEIAENLTVALARQTRPEVWHVLAGALGKLSAKLDPAGAARVCGQAARTLTAALERESNPDDWRTRVADLESWAMWLEPAEASRICGQVARLLIPLSDQIRSTDNPGYYSPGFQWISFVSSRMDPAEADSLLSAAVPRAENDHVRHELVLGLIILAGRRDAAEASKIYRQVARVSIDDLGRMTDVSAYPVLAADLVAAAGQLDKTESAQHCAEAAKVLSAAFAQKKDDSSRYSIGTALASVSARLEPAEAARICGDAARSLAAELDREKDANARYYWAAGLVSLAGLNDQSDVSAALSAALVREINNNSLASALVSLAARSDPAQAAAIYGQAARALASALEHEKDFGQYDSLSSWLETLLGRFGSPEAAPIYSQAVGTLSEAFAQWPGRHFGEKLGPRLSSFATRIPPAWGARILAAGALRSGVGSIVPGRPWLGF